MCLKVGQILEVALPGGVGGGDDLTWGGLASWELEGRRKLWFTEVPTG